MKFNNLIKKILNDFTVAWNRWDFDSLEKILTPDVIIFSPKIGEIYPENKECKLVGRKNLIEYWKLYQLKYGKTHADQISFEKKGRVIKTSNKIIGQALIINEELILNEYGKIELIRYEYYAIE